MPAWPLTHSLPACVAAIALASITTRTDSEERVARRVKAPLHAKALSRSICCHSQQNMPTADRTDDFAFGAIMSLASAKVQKNTSSDDR
jgi:hypothetical protein